MAFTYRYARPSLTVDCVVFGFEPAEADGVLRVLLVKRGEAPFAGRWALPGGFVSVKDDGDQGESLDDAARRELREETGLEVAHLEQLYTFGAPRRDPRGRVVSVAYLALVRPDDHRVTAGTDAAEAAWFSVADALSGALGALAFDHHAILELAAERLRSKVRYAPIGFHLLPKKFTLGDLHKLYEACASRSLDVSNFHKKVSKVLVRTGVLLDTGESQRGRHRPAPLYRFDARAYERAVRGGFDFEI
jgi:8-oxo-dGTP diphosphatase